MGILPPCSWENKNSERLGHVPVTESGKCELWSKPRNVQIPSSSPGRSSSHLNGSQSDFDEQTTAGCMRLPSWGLSGAGLSALRALFPIPSCSTGWTTTVTSFCWNGRFLIETPAVKHTFRWTDYRMLWYIWGNTIDFMFFPACHFCSSRDRFCLIISLSLSWRQRGQKGSWQPLFQQLPEHSGSLVANAGCIYLLPPTWELKVLRRLSCDSLSLRNFW